jgi:transcriptional regulator with XRE-family HTH domain
MTAPIGSQLSEIWMQLIDRKRLARIMAIQGVSARQLARAAGWKSHSYMNRLLSGQVNTLEVEPAVRIAKHLGVGTDDLFLTRLSSDSGRQDAQRKSA